MEFRSSSPCLVSTKFVSLRLAALMLCLALCHAKVQDYADYDTYGESTSDKIDSNEETFSGEQFSGPVEVLKCKTPSRSLWNLIFGGKVKCTETESHSVSLNDNEGDQIPQQNTNKVAGNLPTSPDEEQDDTQTGSQSTGRFPTKGAGESTLPVLPGSCRCYAMDQPLFSPGMEWSRSMCLCDVVCIYENRIVQFAEACAEGEATWQGSHLPPIGCHNDSLHDFQQFKSLAFQSAKGFHVETQNLSWLEERNSVTWKNGTTALLSYDDVAAAHVYDFVAQSIPLAYLNSFMSPPGLNEVDRVVIRRSPVMEEVLSGDRERDMHAIVLQALLNGMFAEEPDKYTSVDPSNDPIGPHWLSERDRVFNSEAPLAEGRVQFYTEEEWADAWEDNPVCLERVVIPGSLTSNLYQGGHRFAKNFINRVERAASVSSEDKMSGPPNTTPNILYIKRDSTGKRGFAPESETAFQDVLASMQVPFRIVDFSGVPFKDQLESVRWADIVIGMHGTNMLNPSLFMKDGGVMLELFPWHFLWRGHGNTSMSHGGVYMGYMLEDPQESRGNDPRKSGPMKQSRFATTSFADCFRSRQCRRMYRDRTQLQLSSNDLKAISSLLGKAVSVSSDILLTKIGTGSAPIRLSQTYLMRHLEQCRKFDMNRQSAWMSFIDLDTKDVFTCGMEAALTDRR